MLRVANACGGIPVKDLPRLFRGRVPPHAGPVRRRGSRRGPGLTIARGLVEAHHGDIRIENVGPGCRVVVRLPVAFGV